MAVLGGDGVGFALLGQEFTLAPGTRPLSFDYISIGRQNPLLSISFLDPYSQQLLVGDELVGLGEPGLSMLGIRHEPSATRYSMLDWSTVILDLTSFEHSGGDALLLFSYIGHGPRDRLRVDNMTTGMVPAPATSSLTLFGFVLMTVCFWRPHL